jgi:hypothetical protein
MRAFGTPLHGFIWGLVPKNNAPGGEPSGQIHVIRDIAHFPSESKRYCTAKSPISALQRGKIVKTG